MLGGRAEWLTHSCRKRKKIPKRKSREALQESKIKKVHDTWLKRKLKVAQDSADRFPKARVKTVLRHTEMSRGSKEPVASTDKEKCTASASCLLVRGFLVHQKSEQLSSLRKKNIPPTPCWSRKTTGDKLALNLTSLSSLYEIWAKQATLVPLLTLPGKETFVRSQNVGH